MDYLKYDWCSAVGNPQATFLKMYNALQATGQTITYSIDRYGMNKVWSWGASVGANLWRTGEDVKDVYYEMPEIGFGQEGLEHFAGPGHWNDPDMLQNRQRRNERQRVSNPNELVVHPFGALGHQQ
jgi:alpha-galactosidase